MKQNDWLIASLNNPNFTSDDFRLILDMNLNNTLFLSKEDYLKSNYIRNNDLFKNDQGIFSEDEFLKYYNGVADNFKHFTEDSLLDDYQYSIWDTSRPEGAPVKDIGFKIESVKNPEHITIGIEGINKVGLSDKSRRELAQNSKIYDPASGKFLDYSVNDISLFSNPIGYFKSLFDDPLVYATYDEDTIETDPSTGRQVKHLKGEWKTNEDGEYYTERLNGRSLIDKQVVSAADYLTSENSAINKYDYMDSDGLDKSLSGTIAKTITTMIPMALGPVGTVYSGLLVAREMSKTLPMLYGMINGLSGNDNINNPLLNTIAAYGEKFSTSLSDYGSQHPLSLEGLGSMISDVALLWGLQSIIAKSFGKLTTGGNKAILTAYDKAFNLYKSKFNQYADDLFKGKITGALFATYTGATSAGDIATLLKTGDWTKTALGKGAIRKYLDPAKKILENRTRLGGDLSLAYMALISNTDVYESVLLKGGTPLEAAAIALGSMIGMFSVDKYLGLGEMFFLKEPIRLSYRQGAKKAVEDFMATAPKSMEPTREGIIKYIQKGIDIGKKTVNNFRTKAADQTLGIVGKSLGEGLEEVSEEFVSDLSKLLGELAGHLGYFSQTDYGAWDNLGERYLTSFIGGFGGGAMFGIKLAWDNRNKSTEDFLNDVTYILRLGNKDQLIKEIKKLKDKGKLGSSTLSYKYTVDSNRNNIYLTADNDNKSQADLNYLDLLGIIDQLDMILGLNNLKLNDDELFDKMVQGEYSGVALSDFLKGDNVENVKDISYISKYLLDFLDLATAIELKELEILQELGNTTDEAKREDPSHKERLAKLIQEKLELQNKKDLLFGEDSLGYVERTLFAMDTKLSGKFISLNYNQLAREMFGKSVSLLTESEKQELDKAFEDLKKTNKLDLDTAFKIYKLLEKLLSSSLEEVSTDRNLINLILSLRDFDINKGTISPDTKLETEEFDLTKLDTESDEQYQQRIKKHEKDVQKYNELLLLKNILELLQSPITSTDRRLITALLSLTRDLLLRSYIRELKLPNYLGQKGFTDIVSTLVATGVEDENKLKEAIKTSLTPYAKKWVENQYGESIDAGRAEDIEDIIYSKLRQLTDYSTDTSELKEQKQLLRESLGMPDYQFKENSDNESTSLTYRDLQAYLKLRALESLLNGESSSIEEDFEGDIPEQWLKAFESATNLLVSTDDSILDTKVILNGKDYNEEVLNILNNDVDNVIFPLLLSEILKLKSNNLYKALQDLDKAVFINNPALPFLDLISKVSPNSNINIESFLLSIYETYTKLDTPNDFLLSAEQQSTLELMLLDIETVKAIVNAAGDSKPIGHNKQINDFVNNHRGVYPKFLELPVLDRLLSNFLIGELNAYLKEINTWLTRNKINTSARDLKFVKSSLALTDSIIEFFKVSRDSLKLSDGTDLLDGFEGIDISNKNLSNVVALRETLHRNYLKAILKGWTLESILDLILPKIAPVDEIIAQDNAKLSEDLDYKSLTSYDKFLILISSMGASTTKFYQLLKNYLNTNTKLAPISIQEYAAMLVYSLKENPEIINKALDYVKAKTNSKLDIAYNTTVTGGKGGAGKTFAITKLNYGEGENVWSSGPTESLVKGLVTSLPKSTGISIQELLKTITDETDLSKLYDLVLVENNVKTAVIKPNIKLKEIQNPPKAIVIDEVTHLGTDKVLLISKWCKDNNIQLLTLGDSHQNGYEDKNLHNIQNNVLLTWRTPDLYISLRGGNVHKVYNTDLIVNLLDNLNSVPNNLFAEHSKSLYESDFTKLKFRYYNGASFSGDLITTELSNELLNKISKDSVIGFIGEDSSPYYKQLVSAGYKVKLMTPLTVLGREFDYTVVDIPWKFTLDSNWYNAGIDMENFLRNLYTIISRSKKGNVIIDNGLSNYVKNEEVEYDGTLDPLSRSIEKFRSLRIPEIEEALSNNTVSEEPEPLPVNDGTEYLDNDGVPDKGIDEGTDVKEPVLENPNILAYSTFSYSGINVSGDEWINEDGSRSDLGIFINDRIKKSDSKRYVGNLLSLKSLFTHEINLDIYDNLDSDIRNKFDYEDLLNPNYYISIEEQGPKNHLIGYTKGLGLTEAVPINNKIYKLVADIKGKDGNIYTLSIAALGDPSTWRLAENTIRERIKNKLTSISEQLVKDPNNTLINLLLDLLNLLDTLSDRIDEYERWINSNTLGRIQIPKEAINFTGYTRLEKLDSTYRLRTIDNKYSPYSNVAPLLVTSPVYIYNGDIPGVSEDLRGKPVRFLSDNYNLLPSLLRDRYIELKKNPEGRLDVRLEVLTNLGVSFRSLQDVKYKDLYTTVKGTSTFTVPFEVRPLAIRMYISAWNFRAGLIKFLDYYKSKMNPDESSDVDRDIELLCNRENLYYNTINAREKSKLSEELLEDFLLDEATYRKIAESEASPEDLELFRRIWQFNDDLADICKEFRLGYNSKHGAYIRKLTNLNTKFYDDPSKVNGIYINPTMAKQYLGVMNTLFENIIDKIIPPISDVTGSYITTRLKDYDGWFNLLKKHKSLTLLTSDLDNGEVDLVVKNMSSLYYLPYTLINTAKYLRWALTEDFYDLASLSDLDAEDFAKITYKNPDTGTEEALDWYSIHLQLKPVQTTIEGTREKIPGVLAYNQETDEGLYDSRLDDMFNLMFHGLISTKVPNDFTRNDIRATASYFKFGFKIDPVIKDYDDNFSTILQDERFFGSNLATSGTLVYIDLKLANRTTNKPTQAPVTVNPLLDFYNKNQDILQQYVTNIDSFKNKEELIDYVEGLIQSNLEEYIGGGSGNYDTIIESIRVVGDTIEVNYLKDNPKLPQQYSNIEIKNNKILITSNDGKLYKVLVGNGKLDISELTPKNNILELTSKELATNIVSVINNYINEIEDTDIQDATREVLSNFINVDTLISSYPELLTDLISLKTTRILLSKILNELKDLEIEDTLLYTNLTIKELTKMKADSCNTGI